MKADGLLIRELDSADHDRWDDFVRSADDGTFYHLSGWKRLIENVLSHPAYYLYGESAGQIVGVLPLARVKSWLFGDALISTPFLVYGGPVTLNDNVAHTLAAAARDLASELGVDYLEMRNRAPLNGDWHAKDTHVTFRKRIDPDPEANLLAIPRKQRAMIRKGIKAGLVAETDKDTSRLYEVLLECKRNLGTPFLSRRWLEGIKREFGDSAEVTMVTHRRKNVCGVMSFYFRDEVLPYYGGGGDLARDLKGNDFMYWAVMEEACKRQIAVFDYGRSLIGSGAYRFKKHWGFTPQPLAYQVCPVGSESFPQLTPSNPRYQFAIRAWKRLPLAVAGFLGPHIATRLG